MSESGPAIPPPHPAFNAANFFARVKNLLLAPSQEWERIAEEDISTAQLYLGHVLPLAIPFVLSPKLGELIWKPPGFKPEPANLALDAIVGIAFICISVWLVAYVIDFFAPNFNAQKKRAQAMKVSAYSGTAFWLAGAIFQLIPAISILSLLGVVSIYTLYKGLPIVMKTDEGRATPYTAATVIVASVLGLVFVTLAGCFQFATGVGRASVEMSRSAQDAAPKAREAVENIKKSIEASSTTGANGEPLPAIDIDKLKRLMPEAIPSGWIRSNLATNAGGVMGFTGSTVEATYEKGQGRIVLRLVDMGPLGAAAAIASTMSLSQTSEDNNGYSRIGTVNGRFTVEQLDRAAGSANYLTIIENRVVVQGEGTGVTMEELQTALKLIDLVRTEQLAKGL
jgi:hypothetical protein